MVLICAAVITCLACDPYPWMLVPGYALEQARAAALLLLVLLETVRVFDSRSATLSVFGRNSLRNRRGLLGAALVQLLHTGAMHAPGRAAVASDSTGLLP